MQTVLTAEFPVFPSDAMMRTAVRADDIPHVTCAPSGFDDCLFTGFLVAEVRCHLEEIVEIGEIH